MITIPEVLEYWARFRADGEVIVCEAERYTWARLMRAARSIASDLQARGVQPGDRVAILLSNCAEWGVAFAGLQLAGAVLVPLNPRFGRFELRAIEEDAGCSALITTRNIGHELADRFVLGEGDADAIIVASREGGTAPTLYASIEATPASHAPVKPGVDALAAIFYTSGSTGLPKGTMQTHATISAYVFGYAFPLQFTSMDRAMIVAPLAFTGASLSVMIPMMMIGACTHVEKVLDPERVLRLIQRERITFITQVPAIWERMASLPAFADIDLSSLRIAMTGGAPVPVPLLQAYRTKGVKIRQVYGATELGSMGCTPPEQLSMDHPTTVGFPQMTHSVRILAKDGHECVPGEIGELCVKGSQVMTGYWRNPEATACAFDKDGYYKTGDLVTRDADGHITIVDRLKNMIISGGVNIYPAEIERAVASIGAIDECGVFGMSDEKWGERVVAIVHSKAAPDMEALRREMRTLLGALKTPREVIFSPDPLPKTVTNKIARQELASLYNNLVASQ